jgi:hypothetical protein
LENSIKRRVVAVNRPYNEVPLIETMVQLGGKAALGTGGNVTLQYQNNQWTGSVNSLRMTGGGKTIDLKKPLMLKNNKVYIGIDELETVIGVQIVYNPTVQSFSVRQTPTVKK